MAGGVVLTSLFFAPAGLSPAGIGVLAPEWLGEISQLNQRRGAGS